MQVKQILMQRQFSLSWLCLTNSTPAGLSSVLCQSYVIELFITTLYKPKCISYRGAPDLFFSVPRQTKTDRQIKQVLFYNRLKHTGKALLPELFSHVISLLLTSGKVNTGQHRIEFSRTIKMIFYTLSTRSSFLINVGPTIISCIWASSRCLGRMEGTQSLSC